MKQSLVGVTGHRPHKFKHADFAKTMCDDAVVIMKRHYGDTLCFNLGGCIGADQWVGESCIANSVKYNLFLPFPAEIQAEHWYDKQRDELLKQVSLCQSLNIAGPVYKIENYLIRDRLIVDSSDFIVCFWEGAKFGGTYETIKYAVTNSKIVLNAMNDLSMVT